MRSLEFWQGTGDTVRFREMTAPLVSVSGVRGIVGESFTPEVVEQWVEGFAALIAQRTPHGCMVLGRDTRLSGEWALRRAADTLIRAGRQPILLDVVPTPTVQLAVRHHRADGGVVMTGSHNPAEWNALKFLGADGVFLSAEDLRIVQTLAEGRKTGSGGQQPTLKTQADTMAIARHIENVLSLPIDVERIRARTFRVVVDPVNGAGALAVPRLLEALGCTVTVINGEPTGEFAHPPEPTPTNLQGLGAAVHEQGANLGVAVDPDADRLVLVDERGVVLSEEYTVTLAAWSVLESSESVRSPIVVNLSTTRMVDDIARRFGTSVVRTPVGERHVVEGMRQHSALIGGEGSGGVIFAQSHEGRDSLVGIALLLDLLARRGTTLGALAAELPRYVMTKEKLPRTLAFDAVALSATLRQGFLDAQISTTDGVRLDTPDGWVHLRPSNTEPVIRLIAEARTEATLERLRAATRQLIAVPA